MSAANVETIRDHYAANARGDFKAALAPLAPDIEWTEAAGFPYAGTYHGVDEVVSQVFSKLGSEWKGFGMDVEEVLDAGDTVVAIGVYSGTYRETGKPMTARVVHVWRLRDGKAVGFEQFADTAKVAEALEA